MVVLYPGLIQIVIDGPSLGERVRFGFIVFKNILSRWLIFPVFHLVIFTL